MYFLRRLASFHICTKLQMFYETVVTSVLFYAVGVRVGEQYEGSEQQQTERDHQARKLRGRHSAGLHRDFGGAGSKIQTESDNGQESPPQPDLHTTDFIQKAEVTELLH